MNWIEELRKQFGLSQETLAVYLVISVSLLKMAEQGHRSLPTSAMLKLAQMQLAVPKIAEATRATAVSNTPSAPKVHPSLYGHAKDQLVNAIIERRKLVDMQGKHQQAMNRFALMTELGKRKLFPTEKEEKNEKLWRELHQQEAMGLIKKYGSVPQSLLQWKIDCMDFAAARATAIINGK